MYLESKNFIVRKLELEDREYIKALEESRPWAKGMLEFKDSLPGGDGFDYFEHLWAEYMNENYFWSIFRKDGQFCGDVQLEQNSETEYHFYIQLMDDAKIEGFGKELFEQLIEEIIKESGPKYLEFELWNLIPMESSLNSSKSNYLPDWNKFFYLFADNQFLEELYIPECDKKTFTCILEKNLKNAYDSARMQGDEVWRG